jgi:hypothetical protein
VSQTTPGNKVGGKTEALQLPRCKEIVVSHNSLRKISLNFLSYIFRLRKAIWIGHILRRNCLLKQVIEGKIKGEMEVTIRRRKKM